MEKPWFVFFFMEHEEKSKEFIPIFDKLAEEFKTTNMYFSAVDMYLFYLTLDMKMKM